MAKGQEGPLVVVPSPARRDVTAYPVFGSFVLLTLALAGFIGLITVDVIDLGMTHFGERAHAIHDVTFGLLFATSIIGILAQVRRPTANVAGMVMAIVPWMALLLAGALATDLPRVVLRNPSILLMPAVVTTALLHPAGRDLFASFRRPRISWPLLMLVGVATAPLLLFTSGNLQWQSRGTDMHAVMGHFGFMAAAGLTVITTGLLASLRPAGWRLSALMTGLLPVTLGVLSLGFRVSSSLSPPWAVGAIAWGVAFIVVAELERSREQPGAVQLGRTRGQR